MSTAPPTEHVAQQIRLIRGHRVMLDRDLAALYGVETGALNRAVKRNRGRFPDDFMFQVTAQEADALRCQFGTSNMRSQFGISQGRGGRRYVPYVFTEQGVAMLSSVLRSRRAIQVNIQIMRTFVRLRGIISTHKDLVRRLDALEGTYDTHFKAVFETIRKLMQPPPAPPEPPPKPRIGFH